MCIAIPVLIVSIDDGPGPSRPAVATTRDGQRIGIDLVMLPDAEVGDYVITHSGYGISRLTQAQATHTLALVKRDD